MKRFFVLTIVLILILGTAGPAFAEDKETCTQIKDGVLTYSSGHYLYGQPLTVGYDIYGYNYNAHMFNGLYDNYIIGRYGSPPITGDDIPQLMMKWNEAWLSNMDCDGDGALDRHFGYASYIGSGAWLTNHYYEEYELDGQFCTYDEFIKIVAAPVDAYTEGGYWYTAEGVQIGEVIWGSFAIIQYVVNDPCGGVEGSIYNSMVNSGFGGW